MSWVIFPMVVSVLWAGVGRGRGLDPARTCGEGEMEHWADRPQQFPICLFDWLILGGAGWAEGGKRKTETGDMRIHTEPEEAEE